MSKELTALKHLSQYKDPTEKSFGLYWKGNKGFDFHVIMEEYAKAKTEEKDKQLMHYAINVCPETDREIEKLQKEVERLSEFEKFCSVGTAKIISDHIKTKAENEALKTKEGCTHPNIKAFYLPKPKKDETNLHICTSRSVTLL